MIHSSLINVFKSKNNEVNIIKAKYALSIEPRTDNHVNSLLAKRANDSVRAREYKSDPPLFATHMCMCTRERVVYVKNNAESRESCQY